MIFTKEFGTMFIGVTDTVLRKDVAMDTGLNLKLKKALAEMLFLSVLQEGERPIREVVEILDARSGGVCHMQFPYAIVYRMEELGYIRENGSRMAADRRRIFYELTENGQLYLSRLKEEYAAFIVGVDGVLNGRGTSV